MKHALPQYYPLDASQLTELWKTATVILDTNVLLGMYRYPSSAREDMLKVLGKLSKRLWIPHQVAVEYQENRPQVLATQDNKVVQVIKALDNTESTLDAELRKLDLSARHAFVNPDDIISKTKAHFDAFRAQLEELRKNSIKVSHNDDLRNILDELIGKAIGEPFSAMELEAIYAEGEERFKREQPPGFLDYNKAKENRLRFVGNTILRAQREITSLL